MSRKTSTEHITSLVIFFEARDLWIYILTALFLMQQEINHVCKERRTVYKREV
jgi:hypothetical protein